MEIKLTSNSDFKSYMDGGMITCKDSKSYKLLKTLKTDKGIYKNDKGYVAIAISDYYGKVGDTFKITLEDNNVFYAIKVDTKKQEELNENHEHWDGSLIEFIIDTNEAKKHYKDFIINGSFNFTDEYKGKIIKIERENRK
jgi:hypothetical protein